VALLCVGNLSFAQKQNDKLEEQIDGFIEAKSYASAIDCLLKLDASDGLSEHWLCNLCYCYSLNNQTIECIQSCNRWLNEYETIGGDGYKERVYGYMGDSYYSLYDYNTALLWYQKQLNVMETADLTDDFDSSYFDLKNDKMRMGTICYLIGSCYVYIGMANEDIGSEMINKAVPYFKKSINLQCRFLNTSIKDVQNGKIHDENLGLYLKDYGICYVLQGEADGFEIIKLAALCGNQDAISICRESNINYHEKSVISNKLFD
jgi:tetratricopeptide (TPR) repeat protein